VLTIILAALAFLSLGLVVWQFVVAMRFPLHSRVASPGWAPPVTLLKPLRGADGETWRCLESWLKQEYAGTVQVLFGVASADDPACEMARRLAAERPERDAQLVLCSESLGMNAKVSTLIQLQRVAKHELVVVSDADVHVPTDFLANIVAPLRDDDVGLVICFYRLANPATLAMQFEAIAVNADFWGQVLQARCLKPLDFALGAVMATTRQRLESIGGFELLVDFLADDYQLGNVIARQGGRIVISPVVAECRESPKSWREVWQHQLRWARTIRACQPLPYLFSILSNATLWSLLWLIASIASTVDSSAITTVRGVLTDMTTVDLLPKASVFVLAIWLARILSAMCLESKLSRSRPNWAFFWLVPFKDLLATAVWAFSFLGNSVEWRGQRYRVRSEGKLETAF
jgi:ceramide glucosyltransferase